MRSEVEHVLDLIRDTIYGAARFRWIGLAVAWVICLVGWLVVLSMPNVYAAKTRVFVDSDTSLQPVLEGLAINQDFSAKVNYVRQALLGQQQIERLVRELGLDSDITSELARSQLIEDVRRNIDISGEGTGGGTVYTISYRSPDRETGIKIVEILQRTFIEETLGGKKTDNEAVKTFLQEEIHEHEQRLREAEDRLAEFKRRNVGLMPGQQGDYFTRLQAEMQEVERLQSRLIIATTRRDELQRQLRGDPGSQSGGGIEVTADTALQTQVLEARARLDDLLLRFTEQHPEVIAARETLEQLERRREEEIAALRRGQGIASSASVVNEVVRRTQLALNEAEVEVAALRTELNDRQRSVAQLRTLVDTAPQVEAEYAQLNRDYDVTRARYNALVERLEKANLGERADSSDAVRFNVLDPPNADFRPVAPKRPLLMAAVFVMSIGAGGGLAYLLNLIKPVIHSTRALKERFGLPVLGVVSVAWMDRHRRRLVRSALAFSTGLGLLFISMLAILAFQAPAVKAVQQILG